MKSPRLSRLLFICAARLALPLTAAEPAPATPPAPVTPASFEPLRSALQEATAVGDTAALRKLFDSRPAIPIGKAYQGIHFQLACAALDLGLYSTALVHHRAAVPSRERSWVAGLAYAGQRDWDRLDGLIRSRENDFKAEPPNLRRPSLRFLRGVRAFFRWRELSPSSAEAVALLAEAERESAAAAHRENQGYLDFDPRFHRLAASVAEATRDPTKIRSAFIGRAAAFPRNIAFARAALAADLAGAPDLAEHTDYLRSLKLAPEDSALWQRAAAAAFPAAG